MAPPGVAGGQSLHWNEVLTEYLRFVGSFLAIGAVGYRYLILPRLSAGDSVPPVGRETAATLGVVGVFLLLLSALGAIELGAILQNRTFAESFPKALARFQVKIGALLVALIGYCMATRKS